MTSNSFGTNGQPHENFNKAHLSNQSDHSDLVLQEKLDQQERNLDNVAISIRGIKEKSYMIHTELQSQAVYVATKLHVFYSMAHFVCRLLENMESNMNRFDAKMDTNISFANRLVRKTKGFVIPY